MSPVNSVARLIAAWRLGVFSRDAASTIPTGFPTRNGVFVTDPKATCVVWVYWAPGHVEDPALKKCLEALPLLAHPSSLEGVNIIVAGNMQSYTLAQMYKSAYDKSIAHDPSHQPIPMPKLVTKDWRMLVTEDDREETKGKKIAPLTKKNGLDVLELFSNVLVDCVSPRRNENDDWAFEDCAKDFWKGTRVTKVVRNPSQLWIDIDVEDFEPKTLPIPTDKAFPDLQTYFAFLAAGKATLMVSLLWEAMIKVHESKTHSLHVKGHEVKEAQFCSGTFESKNPIEIHIRRRPHSVKNRGKKNVFEYEHSVFDSGSHSWIEIETVTGLKLLLETTPMQLPIALPNSSNAACWPFFAKKVSSLDGPPPSEGHRKDQSITLTSGRPVPEKYFQKPKCKSSWEDLQRESTAYRLQIWDEERRSVLHSRFMKRLGNLMT